MKQSDILILFINGFYVLTLNPISVTSQLVLGGLLLMIMLSAHKYFIIREVLNGEHENLINFIQHNKNDNEY